jgi:hypothetical protein
MSDTAKRAKLSIQLTVEQEARLKLVGKWKRRGVVEFLRKKLDDLLDKWDLEADETK